MSDIKLVQNPLIVLERIETFEVPVGCLIFLTHTMNLSGEQDPVFQSMWRLFLPLALIDT